MSDDAQKQGNPPLKRFANLALDGETVGNPTRPIPQQAPPLPRRSPYATFDAQARADFCDRIRNGVRSRSGAMRILHLCPTTVNAWIARGKNEDWPDEDYEYRAFYIQLKAAEAAREALVDLTLGRAAQGVLVRVENGITVTTNVDPDWRAADALGKRHERMRMQELLLREAEAKTLEAEDAARITRTKRILAEAGIKKVRGRLVWLSEASARMTPEERTVFARFLEREGLEVASDDEVAEEVANRDTSEDPALLELAQRYGIEQATIEVDAEPEEVTAGGDAQ